VLSVVGDVIEDTEKLSERGKLQKTENGKQAAEQKILDKGEFQWTEAAWTRLQRVPEGFMRDGTQKRMEDCATQHDTTLITIEIAEEGIKAGLKAMEEMIAKQAASKEKKKG